MNLSLIFKHKPILLIQIILGFTFLLYFTILTYVKIFDKGYIKKNGVVIENEIVIKHSENDYRKIPLDSFNQKIYNEEENIILIYNTYNDFYYIYNFFDYYKGILYSFLITLFFAFISYKDWNELNKKLNN